MKKIHLNNYIRALVEIGNESGSLDQLIGDLEYVQKKIFENNSVAFFLNGTSAKLTEKKQALKTVFQDYISHRSYNFILLLVRENKLQYLNDILLAAKKNKLAQENIIEVSIESPVELQEIQKKRVEELIAKKTGKLVALNFKVTPTMIGGLRMRIEDTLFDGSVEGKIERLRKKIYALA